MNEFLRSIPADSKEPVQLVCYHPVLDAKLRRGEYVEPTCLAVDYEYENPILDIFHALGWQGGTIHQAVAEIKRLRATAIPEGLRLLKRFAINYSLRMIEKGHEIETCNCDACTDIRKARDLTADTPGETPVTPAEEAEAMICATDATRATPSAPKRLRCTHCGEIVQNAELRHWVDGHSEFDESYLCGPVVEGAQE